MFENKTAKQSWAAACSIIICALLAVFSVGTAQAELRVPERGDYAGVVGKWKLRDKTSEKLLGILDVQTSTIAGKFYVRIFPQVRLPGYRFMEVDKVAAAGGSHNMKLRTRTVVGPVEKTWSGYLYMGRMTDGRGEGMLSYLGRKATRIIFHRDGEPIKAPPPATDAYASAVCRETVRLRNEIYGELKVNGSGRETVNDILVKAGLPTNANQSGYTTGKCQAANRKLAPYLKALQTPAAKPKPKPQAPPPAQAQLGPNCTAVQNAMGTVMQQGTALQQKQFRDLLKTVGLSPTNPLAELICGIVVAQAQQIAGSVVTQPGPGTSQGDNWVANAPAVAGRGWTPGPGGRSISHWKNDLGSTFAWQDNGAGRRVMWLWSIGMGDSIAQNRTIRFEGRLRGAQLSGTAYLYRDGCKEGFPFPASGTVEAGPSFVLSGQAPKVGNRCQIVGSEPNRERYTFLAKAPVDESAAVDTATEPPLDTPGIGVWGPSWELHRLPRFETLNVRRGPGTSHAVIGELPETASSIIVIGAGCTPNPDTEAFTRSTVEEMSRMVARSWCNISWRARTGADIEGWVYGKYLRPMKR